MPALGRRNDYEHPKTTAIDCRRTLNRRRKAPARGLGTSGTSVAVRPGPNVTRTRAGTLAVVKRAIGGLAATALAGLAVGLLVVPETLIGARLDARYVLLAFGAGAAGVSLTVLLLFGYIRLRFGRLVKAAEDLAAGNPAVAVRLPHAGLERRLAVAINDISLALAATQEAASIDRMTGVANRQSLLGALFTEVERASRYARPFSLAFVDIDHFKQVNDTYGHGVGDIVLRNVAQTIKANLRSTDTIGRYGGEEFMLLLGETGVEAAAELAEKLRLLVQRLRFSVEGNPNLQVTISIGIAGGFGQLLRVESLIRDADAAMYSAKALGRNQTYVFAEPDEDARVPRAPISPAGRASAVEVGRFAREAATRALATIVAPRPDYRGRASVLIATIVTAMGHQLALPEAEIERLKVAALLHDVGTLAVPEEILEKPTSLTSTEWRSIVQHPRIGQVILEQATTLRDAVPIILHHHERYSGHGYPYGLRGTDIPLGARIVAVADAYDAMTHDRPHRRAMTHEQAITELRRQAGTQFDPELITLFCNMYSLHAPEPNPRLIEQLGGLIEERALTTGPDHAAPPLVLHAPEPASVRRRRARAKPSDEVATG
jgi:diguanylate cyclase (GGDEF)-like protein